MVDVIDTTTGKIIDQIPTGDFPHENEYRSLVHHRRHRNHEVQKVIDFGVGIRPFVVMPNNRIMYAQLSFLHGFVEYDLKTNAFFVPVTCPQGAGRETTSWTRRITGWR
ncbi:MAG TPA: hypothetical protein VHI54_05820 [Actinomycetota bacterium]|nr:hypothetical protein [Actinomycetota bacterium]